MKVTIEFEESEMEPLIKAHLAYGIAVQNIIRAAVKTYTRMDEHIKEGKAFGFGDAENLRRYHTLFQPTRPEGI